MSKRKERYPLRSAARRRRCTRVVVGLDELEALLADEPTPFGRPSEIAKSIEAAEDERIAGIVKLDRR